ncbi:kinesin-like protein KIF20B [Pseudochaenichthys georgianus]|uniref:kinesin-like protein KIF20B n=1 Tax=Pseudochaenichthys georgianus TaxID=52239 RepID=UPI0039C24E27
MMESCLNTKAERRDQVVVEDLRRDLVSEFATLTYPQLSSADEQEHLKVYLRIRPFSAAESHNGESQDCVTIEPPDTALLKPPKLSLSARHSSDKSLLQTGQRFQFSQVCPDADAGILPRTLDVIFSSIGEQVFNGTSVKPQRCREFTRLNAEQQAEEAAFKTRFFRQFKENERSNASLQNSTNKSLFEGTSVMDTSEQRINLEVDTNTKFSVWVSFCEIYNENIHDLLEAAPSGAMKRINLRLSQDIKGNSFVKDLRWVQVNTAEEAYKVLKLGKKNQSFSETRLNFLSSRSHSIFSIRILRIEDIGTPRVHTVSELCLCDLAGSERCAKTQNKGERLKEAGNINMSLLILGKCLNALRHNQQAKPPQHVPFRESKLTHYLQSFFCGRGKACMIVNINQCASMYDETLNVLKFSAVAQKVVVLSSRLPPIAPKRSGCEVSIIINTADRDRPGNRRSSLIGWDSSLEDVQEDEDDEDEEDQSLMESTMDQTCDEEGIPQQVKQLQVQLQKERAENLLMETRVREEIDKEFSELFSKMEDDYKERLSRDKEILEERADTRMKIFKNLIDTMADAGPGQDAAAMDVVAACEEQRRGREEAISALEIITTGREEALASLQKERGVNEKLLESERTAKEKAVAELSEESKQRMEVVASLCRERRVRQEAEIRLEKERKEVRRLMEERETLQQEVREKTSRLETSEQQVTNVTARTTEKLEQNRKDLQQKTSLVLSLTQEVQSLKQEAQTSATSDDQLREEVSELRKNLAEQKENSEREMLELEEDLGQAREQQQQQQQQQQNQQEAALKQQIEDLKKQLQELEEMLQQPPEDAHDAEDVKQPREHILASKEFTEKLREQEVESQKHLDEFKRKLSVQETTFGETVNDLKLKLSEQAQSTESLKVQLEEAKLTESNRSVSSAADEDLKRLNSDLHTEITSLKAEVSDMEESRTASQLLQEQLQEKLAAVTEESAEREAKMASLKERREEEEIQTLQENRRKEAERRREMMAVAHEAIAQKDEALEKRGEEINRLKESTKQDSDKVKSLSVDLQRKEDDSSDLKEQLADYKKQIQQVQKEISAMREEEKRSKQKLTDTEKSKRQLQSDVAGRDRTIQALRVEQSSDSKAASLPQTPCTELEATQRVMQDMRLALTEQEETQQQMETVLEEKLNVIQELSSEVEKLRGMLLQQDRRGNDTNNPTTGQSDDLKRAKQEVAQSQERFKLCAEKHQSERRKWLDEKLLLIGQAKEAEDKRNQEMRKFAEDRERHARQQSQLESLSSQLAEKEQLMEEWRTERDTLVSALEVQLKKLLSSQVEKETLIQQLQSSRTHTPAESAEGEGVMAELQAALSERDSEILRLKEELDAANIKQEETQIKTTESESPATLVGKPQSEGIKRKSGGRRDNRLSVSSQSSNGYPSVLDASEISTENGRMSRFPRPEMEISFSPLQPNRMALRRQGEENSVTVKITRSSRKRKSVEMEKEEVENTLNTRRKATPKLTAHKEETSSPQGRKEGALQKIGDFLQCSPTLLGSKAKKMMSLVSGRGDLESASSSSSSLILRLKKSKRKLYRPEISSPMDMPSLPIISRRSEEKESDHQIIKRRLRTRTPKH